MFPILAGNSASTGYNLTRSLRFRASASAYLNRTFTTPTNNKIWTYSFWVKRGQLGAFQQVLASRPTSTPYSLMYFGDTDNFQFDDSGSLYFATSQLFRDVASWYHIVVAVDTTQATSTNRFKLYVNGAQVTAFSSTTYPAQNYNTQLNTASSHAIGKGGVFTTNYLDGYLTEVNFIDGQALTPSSFGSTNALTGVWQPARYTGTYGTNGFYLPFTDNSALTTSSNVGLGKDFSGNGNYWTTNNISITAGVTYDSMTDVPTLTSATAANFAVLNPLALGLDGTLTNGNLNISYGSSATRTGTAASIGMTSGKYYWEATVTASSVSPCNLNIGISNTTENSSVSSGIGYYPGYTANGWSYSGADGLKYNNLTAVAYGATFTTNDVIGVAFDATAGSITFYKNNTSQGVAYSSLPAGTYYPALGDGGGGATFTAAFNFGQQPFTYTPPTGFVALCTYNLPTSTIVKGNTVMDATTYTGTLLSNAITNAASFKPDLVWVKSRSAATDNKLTDSVRGVTKGLISNTTGAETTDTQGLTAFNTNGFTVGTNTDYNNLAATYVAWQWQAGQGSSGSNTNGTITSTVSVNANAGFSVVTYTGTGANATVGHGLGVAPSLVIVKQRIAAGENWQIYSSALADATYRIRLNTTDGQDVQTTMWNSTAPTSSVFSIGTASGVNTSAATYVAYCWANISGFSSIGRYTGNGSADGTFVYTGVRSKFLLTKRIDTTGNWSIHDTTRNPYNVTDLSLYPNLSAAEDSGASGRPFDILSNGFKARSTETDINASGGTYIYVAYAENPFKNSLAR